MDSLTPQETVGLVQRVRQHGGERNTPEQALRDTAVAVEPCLLCIYYVFTLYLLCIYYVFTMYLLCIYYVFTGSAGHCCGGQGEGGEGRQAGLGVSALYVQRVRWSCLWGTGARQGLSVLICG
jgi:pilus assembly protein TadC